MQRNNLPKISKKIKSQRVTIWRKLQFWPLLIYFSHCASHRNEFAGNQSHQVKNQQETPKKSIVKMPFSSRRGKSPARVCGEFAACMCVKLFTARPKTHPTGNVTKVIKSIVRVTRLSLVTIKARRRSSEFCQKNDDQFCSSSNRPVLNFCSKVQGLVQTKDWVRVMRDRDDGVWLSIADAVKNSMMWAKVLKLGGEDCYENTWNWWIVLKISWWIVRKRDA